MADFMVRDRPQELWYQIEQLHLSYLQTEEIPEKIDQRKKLEGIIWEYLCLVPHERKFHFRETANVLHRSASTKEDFSGYRAASAWNAIGLYASSLLSHPWRKEYRELELYCGFYKHEIEANLVGAEVMLEEMGYKHTSHMTMVLEWPMDPDRVSYVSRDSLVAFVECQLLMRIWEEVSCHVPCSWLEVLEFREAHVGSCELAVRGLLYRFHQRQCEQHQAPPYHQGSGMEMYGTGRYQPTSANCMYSQAPPIPHLSYCGYTPYISPTHSCTLPLQTRYAPALSSPSSALPPYAIPTPMQNTYHPILSQPVLKPQELYPTNGHHPHHHYVGTTGMPAQVPFQNGYSTSHQVGVAPQALPPNYSCAVPTGQLIELEVTAPPQSSGSDTQQISSATDSSSSVLQHPRTLRHTAVRKNGTDKVKSQSSEQPTVVRNVKDDGTGTFDSWDYVYRNLESQGYNKDLGERPDILSPPFKKTTATLPNAIQGSRNNGRQKTSSLDLEEALMEMRLDEYNRKISPSQLEPRALKFNEALQQIRLEGDGEPSRITSNQRRGDILEGTDSIYDNMSSPPKEKTIAIVTSKINSGNQNNKSTTKTLPREFTRHSGASKRDVGSSFATLDPRKMSDRTRHQQHHSTNALSGEVDTFELAPASHSQNELAFRLQAESESKKSHIEPDVKWQCITCTFLNTSMLDICEMCGKSKNIGPEVRPLASGGRECPQCTLVNEKGVGTCEACGTSLKDSPTYI